jgi:hypothetical protein
MSELQDTPLSLGTELARIAAQYLPEDPELPLGSAPDEEVRQVGFALLNVMKALYKCHH